MTTDEAIQARFDFRGRRFNLPWYPRRGTRLHLAELFGELGFKFGAEIGTCRGEYAEALCKANPNLHLTCVDPWMAYRGVSQERADRMYKIAVERLAQYDATLCRKPSLEAALEFADSSLDFVYIDGDHTFDMVVQDIIAWVPKVRREGIVALHDYHFSVGADVVMAINAYTHCHNINPWYVTREEFPTAYWVQR